MGGYLEEIRTLVGHRRVFVPGVRAIIVNAFEEIILQRRRDNGLWGIPGGAVELNETPMEALAREVEEETSLKVVSAQPMGLYCGTHQKFAYPNQDEVQCFALAFIVREWCGIPRADGVEGAVVKFFKVSGLPPDIVAIHKPTIEDYLRYNGEFLLSD